MRKTNLKRIWSNSFVKFILMAAAIFLLPVLFPGQFTVYLLQKMAIMYIVVLGLNIVLGYIGEISLGHAGFYAIGAYVCGLLVLKAGFPFLAGLLLAAVVSALFGAFVAVLSQRVKGPYMAMLTIAFGLAVYFMANSWISMTGGPAGLYNVPKASLFGHKLGKTEYFYLIALVGIILKLLVDNLLRNKWGRTFNALYGSDIAAKTVGINVFRYKTVAFSISACFAGIAGAFFAHQNGYLNSDTFIYDTSVQFVVGVLLGGSGTLLGPLVGAVTITVLSQFLSKAVDYHLMIYGGLLLFAVLVIPHGIVGTLKAHLFSNHVKHVKTPEGTARAGDVALLEGIAFPQGKGQLLQIDGVSKIFGAKKGKIGGLRAVDTVEMQVDAGTVHGLIGPNGSGKTTLVNVITGIYTPDEGNVFWLSENVNKCTPNGMAQREVTRTFQNIRLFGNLTVVENVMAGFHRHLKANFLQCLFHLKQAREEEIEYRDKAMKLLSFMGIAELANEKAYNLAYGDQRRLEIARAMAVQPKLLLLDEPAAGLNPTETDELGVLISKIKSSGVTVFIIEHHLEMLMNICDTVTVLDSGKKIAEGLPKEVRNNPAVIEAYLGSRKVGENNAAD